MTETYAGLVGNMLEIIKNLTGLGAAVALFFFIFGIVKYLTHSDNAAKRTESVQTITYGLIALFVLITVWSLVRLLQTSLLLGQGGLNIPQF
jgi:uncharacterized membrane protein YjfL (UPF0719 family)